jgi:glycerophosphoryl diester phosphodiesterase
VPSALPWLALLVLGWVAVVAVRHLWFWHARVVPFYGEERILRLAHRGVPSRAPENTMPGFQEAFRVGMDGIELDVMQTADGEVVVTHDYDLERNTDGSGYVWELPYQAIAGLNAAHQWGPASPPTPVPRLADVLENLPEHMLVNIELKTRYWFQSGLVKSVVQLVRRYRLVKRTIISSFNPFSLLITRWLEPELALAYIWRTTYVPWFLRKPYLMNLVHPDLFHPHVVLVTPDLVNRAHRRGLQVNVWTVNNRPAIEYLKSIGVDGIFTDFPELVLPVNQPRPE